MYLEIRRDVLDTTSGRVWHYVGTYLALHQDVSGNASGRNFESSSFFVSEKRKES